MKENPTSSSERIGVVATDPLRVLGLKAIVSQETQPGDRASLGAGRAGRH